MKQLTCRCGSTIAPDHSRLHCDDCGQSLDAITLSALGLSSQDAQSEQATDQDPDDGATLRVQPNESLPFGAIHAMDGVQDRLVVYEDRLTITPRGVLGFLNKGLKGTKEIPFSSISAVQIKKASMLVNGYIQFTIPGGNESRRGIIGAATDENTFFFRESANVTVDLIKAHIDAAIRQARAPSRAPGVGNLSDQLQKLADLKERGFLTDEEFRMAKRKLLEN